MFDDGEVDDSVYAKASVAHAEVEENREYISTVEKTVPCEPVMKNDIEAINIQELQTICADEKEIGDEGRKLENVESERIRSVKQAEKEESTKLEPKTVEDSDATARPGAQLGEHISVIDTSIAETEQQSPEELLLQEEVGKSEQQEEIVEQTQLAQTQDEELQVTETAEIETTEGEELIDFTTATKTEIVTDEATVEAEPCKIQPEEELEEKIAHAEPVPFSQDEMVTNVEETTTVMTETEIVIVTVAAEVDSYKPVNNEDVDEIFAAYEAHQAAEVEQRDETAEELLAVGHPEEEVRPFEAEATDAVAAAVVETEPELIAEEVSLVERKAKKIKPVEIVEEPSVDESAEEHITITEITAVTAAREIAIPTDEHEKISDEIPPAADIEGESEQAAETVEQISVAEAEDKVLEDEEIIKVAPEEATYVTAAGRKEEAEEYELESEETVKGSSAEAVEEAVAASHKDAFSITVPGEPEEEEGKQDVMETETELVADEATLRAEPFEVQSEEELEQEIEREITEEPLPFSQERIVTKVEETSTVTETEVVLVTVASEVDSYKPVSKEDAEDVSAQQEDEVEQRDELAAETVVVEHAEEKEKTPEVKAAGGAEEAAVMETEPELIAEEVSVVERKAKKIKPGEIVEEPLDDESAEEHITVTEFTAVTAARDIEIPTEEIPPTSDIERTLEEAAKSVEQTSVPETEDKVLDADEIIKVTPEELVEKHEVEQRDEEAVEVSTVKAIVATTDEEEVVAIAHGEPEVKQDITETKEVVAEQIRLDEREEELLAATESLSESAQAADEITDEPVPFSLDEMVTKVEESTTITETEVVVVTVASDVDSYKPVSEEDAEHVSAWQEADTGQRDKISEERAALDHTVEEEEMSGVEAAEEAAVMETEPELIAEEVALVERKAKKIKPGEIVEEPLDDESAEEHITITEVTTVTRAREIEITVGEHEEITEEIPPTADIEGTSQEAAETVEQISVPETEDKVLEGEEIIKVTPEELVEKHEVEPEEAVEVSTAKTIAATTDEEEVVAVVQGQPEEEVKQDIMETKEIVAQQTPLVETEDEIVTAEESLSEGAQAAEEITDEPVPFSHEEMVTKVEETTTITAKEVVVVTIASEVDSYKPVSKEDAEDISAQEEADVEQREERAALDHTVEEEEMSEVEAAEEAAVMETEPELIAEEVALVERKAKKIKPGEIVEEPLDEEYAEEHITIKEITAVTAARDIEIPTDEYEEISDGIPPAADIEGELEEAAETVEQAPVADTEEKELEGEEIIKVTPEELVEKHEVEPEEAVEVSTGKAIAATSHEEEVVAAVQGQPEEEVKQDIMEIMEVVTQQTPLVETEDEILTAEESLSEGPEAADKITYEPVPFSLDEMVKLEEITTITAAEVVLVRVASEVDSYKPVSKEDVEDVSAAAAVQEAEVEQHDEIAEKLAAVEHAKAEVEISKAEATEVDALIEIEPNDTAEISIVDTREEKIEPQDIVQESMVDESADKHIVITETTRVTIKKEIDIPNIEVEEMPQDDVAAPSETEVKEAEPEMEVTEEIIDRVSYNRKVGDLPILETELAAEAVSDEQKDHKMVASSSMEEEVEPGEVADEQVELIEPETQVSDTQVEVEETELKSAVVGKEVALDVYMSQLEPAAAATAVEDVETEAVVEKKTELTQEDAEDQIEKALEQAETLLPTDAEDTQSSTHELQEKDESKAAATATEDVSTEQKHFQVTAENEAEILHSVSEKIETVELHSETGETWTQSTVAGEITTRKVRIEEREEVTETSSEEPLVLQAPEAESSVSEEVHDDSMKAVAGEQISDEELESDLELLLEESRIKYDISRTEASDPLLELLPQDIAEEEIYQVQEEAAVITDDEVPVAVGVEVTEMPDKETQAETETGTISADLRAVSSSVVEELMLKVSHQTLVDDTGIVYPKTLSSETKTFEATDSERAELEQLNETVAEEKDVEKEEQFEAERAAVDELSTSEEMIENDYTSDASIVMQLQAEEAQIEEAQPGSDEPSAMRFERHKIVQPSDESSDASLLTAEPTGETFIQRDDKFLSDETGEVVDVPDVEQTPLETAHPPDDVTDVAASALDDTEGGIHEVAASLVSTIVKAAGELESSEKSSHEAAVVPKSSRDASVPQTLVTTDAGRSTVVQVVRSARPDGEIVEQVVSVDSESALEALGALPSPQTSLCAGESGEEAESAAVVVYAETVEERPDSETEMTEYEEYLPDGTLVRRKVIKTTRHEAVTRRVVVEETSTSTEQDDQQISSTQFEPSTPAFLRYSDRVEEGPLTVTLRDETSHDTQSDGRSVVTHSTVTSQQKLVMERTFMDVVDDTQQADLETIDNLLSSEPAGTLLLTSSDTVS